jgi:hypothetical protein
MPSTSVGTQQQQAQAAQGFEMCTARSKLVLFAAGAGPQQQAAGRQAGRQAKKYWEVDSSRLPAGTRLMPSAFYQKFTAAAAAAAAATAAEAEAAGRQAAAGFKEVACRHGS